MSHEERYVLCVVYVEHAASVLRVAAGAGAEVVVDVDVDVAADADAEKQQTKDN